MTSTYEYPRAAVTVDCVVFGLDEKDLKVLLIQRKLTPFQHTWALPGGFVRIEETLDEAAQRELAEEAGVTEVYLEQLYTFGALDRDPRERIITVAYYALAKLSDHRIRAATDAMGVGWFSLDDLPKVAFDHAEIVARGPKISRRCSRRRNRRGRRCRPGISRSKRSRSWPKRRA
jgi:8-oxo-dGTP diphosphatase